MSYLVAVQFIVYYMLMLAKLVNPKNARMISAINCDCAKISFRTMFIFLLFTDNITNIIRFSIYIHLAGANEIM